MALDIFANDDLRWLQGNGDPNGIVSGTSGSLYVDLDTGEHYKSNGGTSWTKDDDGYWTGNTSGTCITDVWVDNLHGCGDITINSSIVSSTSTAGSKDSIVLGDNNNLGIQDGPFERSIIISGITILPDTNPSNFWGISIPVLTDGRTVVGDQVDWAFEEEEKWFEWIELEDTAALEVTLYGGSDPAETYQVDLVLTIGAGSDASGEVADIDLVGIDSVVGLTHTTLSATPITNLGNKNRGVMLGEDNVVNDFPNTKVRPEGYHLIIGSGITNNVDNTTIIGKNLIDRPNTNNKPKGFHFIVGERMDILNMGVIFAFGYNVRAFNGGNGSFIGGRGGTDENAWIRVSAFPGFMFNNISGVNGTSSSGVYGMVLGGTNNSNIGSQGVNIAGSGNLNGGNACVTVGGNSINGNLIANGGTRFNNRYVYMPNLNINNIQSFNDDAAAGSLDAGDIYQTTGSGSSPLNVPGMLMVKQ